MIRRNYRRFTRRVTRLATQPRRWQTVTTMCGLLAVSALLLIGGGRHQQNYLEALELNVGADLVGALVTIFLITPIIRLAQIGRVREHAYLNYAWYTARAAGATRSIRLLDTFSTLLDGDSSARFFRGLNRVMDREGSVQILLLDPDSLAVTLRTRELDRSTEHTDVHREIVRNLRALHRFEQQLAPHKRRLFEVRLYSASAGVTLYQWDNRALVSFLSIGRLSGQGAQLEVLMGSQVGSFVDQRFTELWQISRPMDRFLQSRVTLVDADGLRRDFACQYVDNEGARYVVHTEVLAYMARLRQGDLVAHIEDDQARPLRLRLVDDDSELHVNLTDRFMVKYGTELSPIIWLSPVEDGDATPTTESNGTPG
jgi:hypothetical protein